MEKEKPLIKVKPDIAVGFVFQIMKFSAIIIALILAIVYLNFLSGFNVPEFLWEIMKKGFSVFTESMGVIGFNTNEILIFIVEDFLAQTIVQITAVVFLAGISILGTRCYFYADRMEYRKGMVILKKEKVIFSKIKDIGYDKYFNWFNFGSMRFLVEEETLKPIKVSFVNNLETRYKEIKGLIEKKEKEEEEKTEKKEVEEEPGEKKEGIVEEKGEKKEKGNNKEGETEKNRDV